MFSSRFSSVHLHTHTHPPHTPNHSIPPIIYYTTIMGESRSELLAWLNELLQINYTKVEQCGTGAAYCQILDSIYRTFLPFDSFSRLSPWVWHLCIYGVVVDIPMTRVKMNAKHEYEFIANFKVMQNVFKSKRIEKVRLAPFPRL